MTDKPVPPKPFVDGTKRVHFVVSLDAEERETMASIINMIFEAIQPLFPDRRLSVGIRLPPNDPEMAPENIDP